MLPGRENDAVWPSRFCTRCRKETPEAGPMYCPWRPVSDDLGEVGDWAGAEGDNEDKA